MGCGVRNGAFAPPCEHDPEDEAALPRAEVPSEWATCQLSLPRVEFASPRTNTWDRAQPRREGERRSASAQAIRMSATSDFGPSNRGTTRRVTRRSETSPQDDQSSETDPESVDDSRTKRSRCARAEIRTGSGRERPAVRRCSTRSVRALLVPVDPMGSA